MVEKDEKIDVANVIWGLSAAISSLSRIKVSDKSDQETLKKVRKILAILIGKMGEAD